MKRVVIPKGIPAKFAHSFPESATAALAANHIAQTNSSLSILVEESIPKAEEWGEDVASFLENLSRKENILLSF